MMKYFLIIGVGVGIWYYLFVYRKKKLIQSMVGIVDHVKLGLYKYFLTQIENHDEKFAGTLSAAIVNDVFSRPPTEPSHLDFANENQETIKSYVKKLAESGNFNEIITDAVNAMCTAEYALGSRDPAVIIDPVHKLKDLGIYDDERPNPDPHDFGIRAIKTFKDYT